MLRPRSVIFGPAKSSRRESTCRGVREWDYQQGHQACRSQEYPESYRRLELAKSWPRLNDPFLNPIPRSATLFFSRNEPDRSTFNSAAIS
jgi:hypothetical protein